MFFFKILHALFLLVVAVVVLAIAIPMLGIVFGFLFNLE